jgi:hypothetical protein
MHDFQHPLAEVFGFSAKDQSPKAVRYRTNRLCPFNNKVPSCTKDKAKNPLGVCSINYNNNPVITCPVRFREDWLITDDAASFFFPKGTLWSSLTEVRLNDYYGKSAGNIDVVLAAYDSSGKVTDFGALEIQAVYISGNIRDPFEFYMNDPEANGSMDWTTKPNYPRPDFLSSSRKRLVPQLLFKGGILHSWKKKVAVAINKSFFDTLPSLKRVSASEGDIAWFLYDLVPVLEENNIRYRLQKIEVVYTEFQSSMLTITTAVPGDIEKFFRLIQSKLDEKLETPPNNNTLDKLF